MHKRVFFYLWLVDKGGGEQEHGCSVHSTMAQGARRQEKANLHSLQRLLSPFSSELVILSL